MQKVVYKLFGIPVWSVTRTIDQDDLYQRMEKRFESRMTEALEKVLEEKR